MSKVRERWARWHSETLWQPKFRPRARHKFSEAAQLLLFDICTFHDHGRNHHVFSPFYPSSLHFQCQKPRHGIHLASTSTADPNVNQSSSGRRLVVLCLKPLLTGRFLSLGGHGSTNSEALGPKPEIFPLKSPLEILLPCPVSSWTNFHVLGLNMFEHVWTII